MQDKYHLQPIINIAEICAQHKIEKAVLSPGSRCAPLLIAFSSHPEIECKSISDERSAAYIALGIAQSTKKSVVLVCTSGTAAANYLPAIAEAHYQQIPLLVLTADRPPEWIDQQDGQTIRQPGIFGSYVKKSFQFPVSFDNEDATWHSERMVNEAILLTKDGLQGPVHINIPIREPFYPPNNLAINFGFPKIVQESQSLPQLPKETIDSLKKELLKYRKVLLVKGQDNQVPELGRVLEDLPLPIVVDIISNEHELSDAIKHQDAFLGRNFENKPNLQPDLLITFGKSLISKQLKLFLRNNKSLIHWHVQPYGEVADTFQSLQRIIRTTPSLFFTALKSELSSKEKLFKQLWIEVDEATRHYLNTFFESGSFGEFWAINKLMQQIPNGAVLHLANSMAVRYANFIGLDKHVEVYSNRGTSGIDGCLSTAVGHAVTNDKLHFVITGDLAFFYDANSFWNTLPKENLRIFLINNFGGAIFGMIPGPSNMAAYNEFFVTKQERKARDLAKMHQIDYVEVKDSKALDLALPDFVSEGNGNPQIIEVLSSEQDAVETMQAFRTGLQKYLDSKL